MADILSREALLPAFAAIVGERNILTADADVAPYVAVWRGFNHGRTPARAHAGGAQVGPDGEVSAILLGEYGGGPRRRSVPIGRDTRDLLRSVKVTASST